MHGWQNSKHSERMVGKTKNTSGCMVGKTENTSECMVGKTENASECMVCNKERERGTNLIKGSAAQCSVMRVSSTVYD